jgi:hypothetical protein
LNFLNLINSYITKKYPLPIYASIIWFVVAFILLFFQQAQFSFVVKNSSIEKLIYFILNFSKLSIPLLLMCTVTFHRFKKDSLTYTAVLTSGIILLFYTVDALLLNSSQVSDLLAKQHRFILMLLSIVVMTFIPFLKSSMREFWVVNNIMFVKLLKALIVSFIMLLATTGLLFSVDLFSTIIIDFFVYKCIFIIFMYGFFPLYFLFSMPIFLKQKEVIEPKFPKFYLLFTTGYLLPLTIIGIGGMYVYFFLHIMYFVWPPIEVVLLFLLVANLVIFLMFQFELLASQLKNKLVTLFLKYICFSIIPLGSLCLVQLINFLNKEGFTEFWYSMAWGIIWILGVCLYFSFSKIRDIRIIPITLSVILCVLLVPPMSPFSVSIRSQYNHLIQELKVNNIIGSNELIILDKRHEISQITQEKIKARIYFLNQHNHLKLFQKYYPYPIDEQSISVQRLWQDLGIN